MNDAGCQFRLGFAFLMVIKMETVSSALKIRANLRRPSIAAQTYEGALVDSFRASRIAEHLQIQVAWLVRPDLG